MESTNGGRNGPGGGVTNGTNGDSHGINGVENGRIMSQVNETLKFLKCNENDVPTFHMFNYFKNTKLQKILFCFSYLDRVF